MSDENKIAKYTVSGISDVLSCFGIPSGTAINIYNEILSTRAEEAFEILMSEIRQGNFENIDQNEVVSVIARYQRDAMEGVARENLRLLARVINGMAEKHKLSAPSFLRYANILASLTEKEIRVLAVMTRFRDADMQTLGGERHDALMEITQQAEGHLQALLRTGLVNMRMHTARDLSDRTHKYHLTKLMDEILEYIPYLMDQKEK